ncbi:hypothetical protein B0T20DRAFT_476535 [Sordaria brevicollis]|uniref:LysM domain-containing protein n=1 Tax=Sordaria brevicollis TaxID=83679 RepID=A0AAE0PI77_SORBR|nr:hypothetical protein B0T20DRAFT_476535 [Sordaria brevicollis]
MQLHQGTKWPHRLLFSLAIFNIASKVVAETEEDGCAPVTWDPEEFGITFSYAPDYTPVPVTISPLLKEDPQPGEINCRDTDNTKGMEINEYTCIVFARRNRISVDTLFGLNPGLEGDCGKVEADTEYCVRGFIEPIRAWDGLCGPPHNNATCLGTDQKTAQRELATKAHA